MANRKQRRAAARKGEEAEPDGLPEEGDGKLKDPGAVPFPDHEKDVLFKVQMHVQNLVIGFWKQGLTVIGVVLLGVLAFGLYEGNVDDAQKAVQARIANIDRNMPEINPLARAGFADLDETPEVIAEVEAGAGRYEAVAAEAKGVGAAMAWIRAADAWQRAGNKDQVLAAYQAAHHAGAAGVVGWAATSSYASALADGGDVDGATSALRTLSDSSTGIQAEKALLALAQLLEDADRVTESRQTYSEFSERFPQSTLANQAALGMSRLGAGG